VDTRQLPEIKVDVGRCAGCLLCELRCSLRFEKAFNPIKAAIRVRRQVNSPNEYSISFTDKCDRCGLCVQFCLYGALTQEGRQDD
jgi:ferredoxin